MPDSKVINNPFLDDQNTNKVTEQSVSKFDPSTAKPVVENQTQVSKDKNFNFDPSTAKAVDKGFSGHARDLGASLMSGLAAVPDIAVGVADLYTGGRAGKAVDNLSDNFKLGQAQKYWQDQKTDQAKVQSQQFADAEGIIDKTKVALSNPSMIANTVTESLPSMAVGGLAGRGINIASKGAIGAAASGAIGEGAVMAGSQAEQIRQKTDDGLLTGKQTAAAAGTGVAGSLLGFLGGTVAKKLGFEDVDTLMAKGVKPEQVAQEITQIPFSSIPKSVVLGAISEGLLEEMPQSVTEQVLQNYALDKDLFEGVDDAIVMGTLAGMAMGGTVAGTSQASKWAGQPNSTNPDTNDDADTTGLNPLLPAPTGGDGGTGLGFDGLQGEYIPAGQQGTRDPVQARQNFEYDQMPTDAERQIEFGGLSRQYALTPSEQMGIDPNVGPLSSAAATAVDTGISQQFQIEMQAQATSEASPNPAGKTEDNNAPLQQAAETARQLTPEQIHGTQNKYSPEVISALETLRQRQQGEQSGSVTLNESTQNEATQRGNAQTDNGSQPLSEQYDTNATSAMGTATGAAQDGLQPTQFDASQVVSPNQSVNKTQTSEAKSKLLDTQSKVTELEAQLATEKSVPKKAQLRKRIAKLQQDSPIDQAAHAAATSIQNDLPEPTQAQIEAGNYKKGHINVHGLNIAVENPRGSERRGTNPDGEEWAHNMSDHYGYIKRTTGADNEQIDTYVGRNPESDQVFIVDQIDQQTGGFDEHKVMLGFNSQEDAVQAYSSNFDDGWKVGPVRTMTQDEFKSWLKDGDTKKPASDTQVQPIAGTLMSEEGKTEKVYTPSNREIEVRHKLVEADSLIASNHGNGSINENFPQELQPRDRTRPSSQAQVNDIANNLNPKLLGNSPSTANGAPIVSKDNIVESGNGRIMAVRKAYEQGKGEAYKQWLSEQGYDVSKMKNPVLVRERVTELSDQDRIAYTKESNERTTLDLSPTERAIADADSISNILEDYAGGDLNSTANRTFVNKFVTGVVSTNERAAVIGADKALTQQGKRRIQGALVAAAYGDSTIINQVFEDTDSEIKAIGNALTDVAGVWGLMRKLAQQGSIPAELDITPNLIEAVHLVHKARTEKRKLIELVAQDDIFAGEVDQVTKDFLSIFYRGDKYTQARSREKVADALSYYANQAQQIKPGANLFGEEPQTETDLIRETNERQQNQEANKQQDIFASPQSNDSNAAKPSGTGQRTATQGADVKAQSTQGLNTLTQIQSDTVNKTIQDFGEKIGGARKDTAVKTGKKSTANKEKDDRPTWAKRYEISEIAASLNPEENGKWIISDSRKKDWKGQNRIVTKERFNTQAEAEAALPLIAVAQKHRVWTGGKETFAIYREISDRKRVKVVEQEFKTRDEAMQYMASHAVEILETNTTFGEIDLPRPENTQRKGTARRTEDAKDSDFTKVFGFRGVEFGNWNNQVERQELLNDAFDGLTDLAEVLNIPPEAISLNGELALAFGARGHGLSGAAAHYEPERVVINLTKMNGAGSLAHEWWHALDHYFGRQDGKASSAWITNADGSRSLKIQKRFEDMTATSGFSRQSNVREDVRNAYNELVQTIFKKSETYVEDTIRVESFVSDARDNLKSKLDQLRNDLNRELDPKYYRRFNKAASAEQLAEFDTVVELLLTGTALSTELRYSENKNSRNVFSGARWSNDALDKLSAIYKAVRGRSGFNAEQKGILDQVRQYMNAFSQRLKLLAEAQQGTEKAKMIPTNFAMNAKELDQGRGTDYWITTPEMTARAFQGYVEDKIAARSAYSPFLNYGPEAAAILTPWGFKRPYPTGDERVKINKAFDTLIDNFKTEKTEQGTKLYSRAENPAASSTVAQVRETLVSRFGEKTIADLETQGILNIVQDQQESMTGNVEGWYENGKITLVASNLDADSAIATFLHELGGHGGFQNLMNKDAYADLMRQFERMVEQGNPVAVEAKRLAERELNKDVQLDEYLPYMITLASQMQLKNVVQKGAIKRFMDRIVSAVKAWLYDKGIKLNLNENDVLALAERMVEKQSGITAVQRVKQQLQNTSTWMKAPNGNPTRLTEQQWLQVRTPAFKRWFGDWENNPAQASQAVDENGEPKIYYHGTAAEFSKFNRGGGLLGRGVYLTDDLATAQMYGDVKSNNNGIVMPLFVNTKQTMQATDRTSREQIDRASSSGRFDGIRRSFQDMDFLVAFNSNQVKHAMNNEGSFDGQNDDIRFSRQFNAQQTFDNIMNGIKGLNVQSTKNWAGNKWIDWLGLALSGLGRRQLTEIYSKILPSLGKYNELAAQMDADKNDAGAEADTIVREWSNLKDDNQLADLMHDATLAKIDPAKPHVAGDSIIKYKQLRDDFNALSPEAQDIYLKARDAYKKHYAKVHQAIKERILRSELSNTKKAELLKDMDNQFFGYVKGVYFPLARFGKYVVIVRNQNGQVESVSRAETMAEAQKARAEMMKKFPLWKVDRVILDKEFNASRDGVGRGFMSSLFSEVDNLGLSTAEQAEFEDTLSQLYLSSMPDLSWAKHGIHRKGTAGFSQDARRAFAQNMFHGAGYLAKLRYADQMAEQLDEMQKYATEQVKINSEYDQPKAQRVIDEMNKRHENLMNPKSHPLSSMLTSVGFIYYLGLSPAAAMVNLSQTPLVAYPIMGAKWGFDNAAKELLKASNDFRKGVEFHKVKWEGTKTDLYKAVSADISKFLNKDEQQAYKDAVDRGVIDVTQAHDLAGIAQGEDSGVMWKIRPIMRAASTMFHTAERFNREVTFIAAYRLSRQTGATHDTAFAQAVDATYKGHFDYSSGNRPRIMQGNVAKVLLLFKQFGQNMIYTLSRQTYQSIKGETETERKEARRALGAVLGMHAAFAGVLGLPLVGFLLGAASWMGGDDDDPWDAEIALRNYLAETFNPTISNLIMKGVPRAVTPIDMSGRVGINNLLLPDVQEGLEGKRWAESAMSAALGPVAGIGTNMVKGAQEISEGHNLRGVETMLPVFLKNFAKTYRYSDEGVQDKTGVSIMDEVSSMDLLVQGMGFSPSDIRTANEGKSAIFNANRKLNERRSSLMTLWSRAKMMDDQEEMDSIWKEIQGFNEKNPTRRITRMNLNQSYRNRKRRIDRAEYGVYLNRNQQGVREAGNFAFAE